MADMTKFADLIRQFAELFDRLIPLEQEKLDSVKQKDRKSTRLNSSH